MADAAFRRRILSYYRAHGRHALPWRKTKDPYRILVSEIMLQQTQVPRVIDKYREFLRVFPSFRVLASASTADVVRAWQGLGYNRRALMLQRCAVAVVQRHRGRLPQEYEALCALPGIGPYTAGAIRAFAFDAPQPVIETNIRRVYLYHFFPTRHGVSDAALLPLVTRHLGQVRSPRQWYSALMDYGTHLATIVENPNARSRHYTRQSAFEGSVRQLRGRILKHLSDVGAIERSALAAVVNDSRAAHVLSALEKEGFIRVLESVVHLVV